MGEISVASPRNQSELPKDHSAVNLREVLERNKRTVDDYIFRFLPKRNKVAEISLLYRMMRDYPARLGKGLRSSLCLLTCEAFGGQAEKALVTASAFELFHNWILVHDDIEDMSEMRRKQPVLHRKYGIPLAINTGDALHGRMWDLLLTNRSILGDEKTLQILQEIRRTVNETTEGQHMELTWVKENRWDLTEEDYLKMCTKKTSWFTCISPCRAGAIIADADPENLETLTRFGADLGVAFQIRDDILNLTGEEAKYGKEISGDIWEGKRTLVLIRLLKVSNKRDRNLILSVMNKKREEKTRREVLLIRNLIKDYGATDFARRRAERLAHRARLSLTQLSRSFKDDKAKDVLFALVDFMVSREW